MSLLVPPSDAVQDWSPSNGCESPDPGTSPPLHERLQHLSLRKKTSYRYCDVMPHTCAVDRVVFMTAVYVMSISQSIKGFLCRRSSGDNIIYQSHSHIQHRLP